VILELLADVTLFIIFCDLNLKFKDDHYLEYFQITCSLDKILKNPTISNLYEIWA
jgi:hypothetical protein